MPDAFDRTIQRTVPAAGSKLHPNASPFAAGEAAKPKRQARAPLDVANVPIKSGVPIPEVSLPTRGPSKAGLLLGRMKAGDCVELSKRHANGVKAYAKKAGVEITLRTLGPDPVGIWRLK